MTRFAARLAVVVLATACLASCTTRGSREAPAADSVVIFALDGAEWRVLEPLLDAGELPNFRRVIDGGASGELKTVLPTLSPLVWTSIITGRSPESHGILDFWRDIAPGELAGDEEASIERLQALGYVDGGRDAATDKRLYRSTDRRAPALWNRLSDDGLDSKIYSWWVTYPAEAIRGHIVSDRFLYNRFELDSKTRGVSYATDLQLVHPGELAAELDSLTVRVEDVTAAEMARFIDGAVELDPTLTLHDVEDELRIVLAKDASVMAFYEQLRERSPSTLTAIYIQGVDIASHYFWKYRFPGEWLEKFPGEPIPAEELARYGRTVDEYYRLADEYLGRVLDGLAERETLVICSDHGFVTGRRAAGAFGAARTVSGVHGRHAPDGVLIMAGAGIRPGTRLAGSHILDIAPTLLTLLGRDVPGEFEGRVLSGALTGDE